jgi:hypothetical protein
VYYEGVTDSGSEKQSGAELLKVCTGAVNEAVVVKVVYLR